MGLLDKVTKYVTLALFLSGSTLTAKNHYVVGQKQASDHAMVQASTPSCELCFFNDGDSNHSYNPSTNKFCLTTQMYFRVGQAWDNDHASINKANRSGYNRVKISYYAKSMFNIQPAFKLTKLFTFQQQLSMPEKYARVSTRVGYQYFQHLLCVDIWTELEEIVISINQQVQFIKCYKILVGYLFDFGQYSILSSDTINTMKPYGPFAKLLDSCQLGNSQSWASKQYKPFSAGYNPAAAAVITKVTKQFWVGDGEWSNGGCFPGNMLMWLIDMDRFRANLYAQVTPQAPYIPKDYKGIGTIGSDNLNNYIINFVQPWVDVAAGSFVNGLRDTNQKPEGTEENHVEYAQFGAPYEQEKINVEATIA